MRWHKHSDWDDDVITRDKWTDGQARRHREVKTDYKTLPCSINEHNNEWPESQNTTIQQ